MEGKLFVAEYQGGEGGESEGGRRTGRQRKMRYLRSGNSTEEEGKKVRSGRETEGKEDERLRSMFLEFLMKEKNVKDGKIKKEKNIESGQEAKGKRQ